MISFMGWYEFGPALVFCLLLLLVARDATRSLRRATWALLLQCARIPLLHVAHGAMRFSRACMSCQEKLDRRSDVAWPPTQRRDVVPSGEDGRLMALRDAANDAATALAALRRALPVDRKGVTVRYPSGIPGRSMSCHVLWDDDHRIEQAASLDRSAMS